METRLNVQKKLNRYGHGDNYSIFTFFIIIYLNSYSKITSFIINKVSERLHTQCFLREEREEEERKGEDSTPHKVKIFPQEDYETSHDSQRETVMARQQGHKISTFLCKYIPASARSDLTLFFFPS